MAVSPENIITVNALERIRQTLRTQSAALDTAAARLDDSVDRAVELLLGCPGKIVVMGMGKCAHVGRKVAATLASTGTPALFVHPAEAIHGDIGMVSASDVVVLLSNSGETPEIKAVLPSLKKMDTLILGLLGTVAVNDTPTTVAAACAVVLDTAVEEEGDTLNLAPMASTTVMMALGDALATVLMEQRGLTRENYALLHPGGSLGQKLLCTVDALMHTGIALPLTPASATLHDAIVEMTTKRLGATFIVDQDETLAGIITDGDIRRMLEKNEHPRDLLVTDIMMREPKTIGSDVLAVDALRRMEDGPNITILPVVDHENRPVGALHIHDLIRAGIA
jgi:arabinose-5-phosphate isomerase